MKGEKMSKIIKKVLIVLLAIVLVLPALPALETQAASKKPKFAKKMTVLYYPKSSSKNRTSHSVGSKKVSNVKSSNKKVLTVKQVKEQGGGYFLNFTTKKSGTSTVSFKAKVNGKTYTYKCKVTVRKYENPFKTLEFNSQNYASNFKNTNKTSSIVKLKMGVGKLNIVPKKNWKISKIEMHSVLRGKRYITAIKNGAVIDSTEIGTRGIFHSILITMRNTKTGIEHDFRLNRPLIIE